MPSLNVLVIDDSATNRLIVRKMLQDGEATVLLAATGKEGTEMAIEHRPDVIVLDVVLPDADGMDLCRQWHKDPRLADIPVLLISGERLADEDRAAGLRSGALGYLLKPFSDIELLAQVHLLDQLGRTHQKLKRRNAELEASNRELEQFAYVVSHDLKEPLRTISGYCDLLGRRYGDQLDEKAGGYVKLAVRGALRMQRLIDDLLAYSHVGKTNRPMEDVDLAEVLAEVMAGLEAAVEEGQATVEVGDLPTVRGNRLMLTQLFQNLLGNAIKFRGESPPVVRIVASQTNGRWQIWVADNGIGIESRHFDRIFGVFQRLHQKEEYSGTGIGLAICRKIVDYHGGRIWPESEPGKGTTFHIELPARSSPLDE